MSYLRTRYIAEKNQLPAEGSDYDGIASKEKKQIKSDSITLPFSVSFRTVSAKLEGMLYIYRMLYHNCSVLSK